MSIGSCLLYGVGISIFSTGIYMVLNDKRDKNDYICIFSIIFLVSVIILYITHGGGENLVHLGKESVGNFSEINNIPPF